LFTDGQNCLDVLFIERWVSKECFWSKEQRVKEIKQKVQKKKEANDNKQKSWPMKGPMGLSGMLHGYPCMEG
jgi:hypothetical protein